MLKRQPVSYEIPLPLRPVRQRVGDLLPNDFGVAEWRLSPFSPNEAERANNTIPSWWNFQTGYFHKSNPFIEGLWMREQYVFGRTEPEFMVHNFSDYQLTDEDLRTIDSVVERRDRETHGEASRLVNHILIADCIDQPDMSDKQRGRIEGVAHPLHGLIVIEPDVLIKTFVTPKRRKQHIEAVLSHEIEHILAGKHSEAVVRNFAFHIGCVVMSDGTIRPLGDYTASSEYGKKDMTEDVAETRVAYVQDFYALDERHRRFHEAITSHIRHHSPRKDRTLHDLTYVKIQTPAYPSIKYVLP